MQYICVLVPGVAHAPDIHVDALQHKQILNLISSTGVSRQREANTSEHYKLSVNMQLSVDAGGEALEAAQDDAADIRGFFHETGHLIEGGGGEGGT